MGESMKHGYNSPSSGHRIENKIFRRLTGDQKLIKSRNNYNATIIKQQFFKKNNLSSKEE